MKRAASVEISNPSEKADTKFSKAITSDICQYIFTNFSPWKTNEDINNEDMNELLDELFKLDPCSSVAEGEFKGVISLMLYCMLWQDASRLLKNNFHQIYGLDLISCIKYPNLDINATRTGEGAHKNKSVLWIAAYCGEWRVVDNLIDMGADINVTCIGESPDKGKSVLWFTTKCRHPNLTDKLINMGADIHNACTGEGPDKGKTVLWLAVEHGECELVDKLINMGADIHATCIGEGPDRGKTVLCQAAYGAVFTGEWGLVYKLIEMGANIYDICKGEAFYRGGSVLWHATNHGELKLVYKLIKMGADIHVACREEENYGRKGRYNGTTVLWIAAHHKKWKLVDKLIKMGADINATCRGGSDFTYKGKSVLYIVAHHREWELVGKLIRMGADINATWESRVISVLGMAQSYNIKNKDNLQAINKDIFYLIMFIMCLRSKNFIYPSDVNLSKKDKIIIDNFKNTMDFYLQIFIPSTIHFADNNYYKKNNLNDLPEEIKQLIVIECIQQDFINYSLDSKCIEYIGNEIFNHLFNCPLEDRLQAQNNLENGLHLYELVLFSSILSILRDNTNMLDLATRDNMSEYKRAINETLFKNKFLPAFEQAKLQNASITTMNSAQRLKLYETARQYGNRELLQKPKGNILTEDDFSAIFSQIRNY